MTCICSCFVSLLRSAAIENTEEAWIKLFMLPKCVLLTPKRKHNDFGNSCRGSVGSSACASQPGHSKHHTNSVPNFFIFNSGLGDKETPPFCGAPFIVKHLVSHFLPV